MRYDVIILGLGAMGGAAALELARRGRRVLGLEQFALGHDRGSSHGQTRVIRKAYFEDPDYVPLVRRSYEKWFELEQRQGKHLLTECGCLNLGLPDGEVIPGVRAAARQHGLAIEELSAADLRRRFPQFQFDPRYEGVLEREAGFLYVEECVRAQLDEAAKHGAELRENQPVLSWRISGGGVEVKTQHESFGADRLIVTAGAWAGRVLAPLGLPLVVRRKPLLWFAVSDPTAFRRDRFPIYLAETPAGFYYGFPMIDSRGHKVARHDAGQVVADPATVERDLLPADIGEIQAFLRQHLPAADGPVQHGKVCLYTVTPDQHFLIDRHPEHAQVAIAAGFSGHGFKFAPVVGEALADLADQGRTDLPISMFRIDRFGTAAR